MHVRIDSGPITANDSPCNVPREKWRQLMTARRLFLDINVSYACRCLIEFVNDAQTMFGELGFASAEDMIRNGYGLGSKEIAIAAEWLRLEKIAADREMGRAISTALAIGTAAS